MNYAKVKCIIPALNQRLYDDDIQLSLWNNSFYFINQVELENYVAGVVESEGGQKANIEYYKTQAVICRTYALENLNRHLNENYNLCDDVHCQAFKGKSLSNFDIPEAVESTAGMVIIDSSLNLITAGFYSNCGGQTVNSEDVWLRSRAYLRSITDTFCLHQKNSVWEKKIPSYKWKQYLNSNGFSITDTSSAVFSFNQPSRKVYYKINGDSMALRKIRLDWNLRSTFFNIKADGQNIVLSGRGYGHGVGLCQEGAMIMAKRGYSYQEIIKYYYKNTTIVNLRSLTIFRDK
jgi:stage II sporulation protein D